MNEEEVRRDRATGNDLKQKIIDLVESHPARQNRSLVFAVLAELALPLVMDSFGRDARDVWIAAFDDAARQVQPPGEGA